MRFGSVGVCNTAISFLTFYAMIHLTEHPFFSQVVSYSAGIIFSYVLNSIWTFTSTMNKITMVRFFILQLVLLLLSSISVHVFVKVLLVNANISWLLVMVVITIINFLLSNVWVFKQNDE